MKKIFLLRHGHSTLTGKYVGSTDCPLSEKGQLQIENLAHNNPFDSAKRIIASPMLRCKQTYQGLNLGLQVTHEEKLREIDFGLWEGLDFNEVYSSYRTEFDMWCKSPESFCFPQGESVPHFAARLHDIPDTLKNFEGDTLVVAHGGVIRHLLCLFLGLPGSCAMKFQLDVAGYAVIDVFDNDFVLSALNHK